ncbi:SH3 domain-containing protein [Streptomyces noursei]|uniref:SH3 domain-containing protein n=1 Tax=Streptomyces noursei TaxID=1971 RepID=UPI0035E080EB
MSARRISVLSAAVAAIALPLLSAPAATAAPVSHAALVAAAPKGCYVTASSAMLRSKASTSSTAVGITYRGNRCSEKGYDYHGGYGWTKVTMTTGNATGKTGWIRDDLLHTMAEDIPTCIPEDESCHS